MKSTAELRQILDSYRWYQINAHVHTSLCDGKPDMTLENIAAQAFRDGVKLVILVPHYHKQRSDESATLYTDTDISIYFTLRQQIDQYHKVDGRVQFLLSAEVDILDMEGNLCMEDNEKLAAALDLITPTMNYHPLLPLRAVDLTAAATRDRMYEENLYPPMAEAIGGIGKVLEAIYTTQANAISKCKYPAMLGHFFAAHSRNGAYSWFGAQPEHLPIMKEGAKKVLEACRRTGTLVDITGIRIADGDIPAKRAHDGFLYDFQLWFLEQCQQSGVGAYPGGDAHNLGLIGGTWFYADLYGLEK